VTEARKTRCLVSAASAPGWAALFTTADDPTGEPRRVTLAAWALVEEVAGDRTLVGLVQQSRSGGSVGAIEFCDEQPNFAGYAHRAGGDRGD